MDLGRDAPPIFCGRRGHADQRVGRDERRRRRHREQAIGHLPADGAYEVALVHVERLVPRHAHLLLQGLAVTLAAVEVHVVAAALNVDPALPTVVHREEDALRAELLEELEEAVLVLRPQRVLLHRLHRGRGESRAGRRGS